jgi:diacylglycerol kinase (ATP)
MESVLIFANPIAGRGKGKVIAETLAAHLSAGGYAVQLFLDRASSAKVDRTHPIKAAIVIGGDGTLRSVAQWAIDAASKDGHTASGPKEDCLPYPLLIVPMGTANLMGRHLGIDWDHQYLAKHVGRTLKQHRIAHLDVARTAGGIFLLMAGVGFDAWVVHEMDRIRQGPITMADYLVPAVRAVTEYAFPTLTVTVDGRRVFDREQGVCLVGNIAEYGTGFPILPLAKPDDQLLDVCVMPCSSRGDLIKLFLQTLTQEHIHQEGVIYVKGKKVSIDSPRPVPVQVDGEPAGMTPISIDLLPGRIPFIVPASSFSV